MTKVKHEIAVEIILGAISISILSGLVGNEIQKKAEGWVNKVIPGVPYFVVLTLLLAIMALIYIVAKKQIKKSRNIEEYKLENEKNITPAVKTFIVGIKSGRLEDSSLRATLNALGPKEFKEYAELIRLKIGRRRSVQVAKSFYKMGYYHRHTSGNIQLGKEYYQLAAEFNRERPVYPNEVAEICLHQNNYEEAIKFFLAAQMLYKKDKRGLYTTQNNLAMCYLKLKKYEDSLDSFLEAGRTCDRISKKATIEKVKNLANIGALCKDMKKYEDSMKYLYAADLLLASVMVWKRHEIDECVALKGMIPRTLGELYLDLFKVKKDKEILDKALQYALKAFNHDLIIFGEKGYTPLDYTVLGKVYDELNLRDKAVNCYKNAYSVLSEIQIEVHEARDHCKKRLIEMGEK